MQWFTRTMLAAGCVLAGMAGLGAPAASAASERPVFISIGPEARPPIGWVQFCGENPGECAPTNGSARDVVLSQKAWNSRRSRSPRTTTFSQIGARPRYSMPMSY